MVADEVALTQLSCSAALALFSSFMEFTRP